MGVVHEYTFWALLGLVALHISAIIYHAARGTNLVKPMITGMSELAHSDEKPRPTWRGLMALSLAAFALWVAIQSAPPPPTSQWF